MIDLTIPMQAFNATMQSTLLAVSNPEFIKMSVEVQKWEHIKDMLLYSSFFVALVIVLIGYGIAKMLLFNAYPEYYQEIQILQNIAYTEKQITSIVVYGNH